MIKTIKISTEPGLSNSFIKEIKDNINPSMVCTETNIGYYSLDNIIVYFTEAYDEEDIGTDREFKKLLNCRKKLVKYLELSN